MHRTRWALAAEENVQVPDPLVQLPNLYDLKVMFDFSTRYGYMGPCENKLPDGFDSATVNWDIGNEDAVVGGVTLRERISHHYPELGGRHLYIEYFGANGSLGITRFDIGPDGAFYTVTQ